MVRSISLGTFMTDSPAAGPRERLLEAAEQLIYSASIHGTGVDAIVRQSGTARKSFYAYFSSKDELIAAALQRRDERWMNWFEQGTRACAAAPADQLLGMFDVLHEWFSSDNFHGCAFLNAAGEIKRHDHDIFQVSRLHKERLLAFIEERCRAAGSFAEPVSLARQLLILLDGAIAVALVSAEPRAAYDAQRAAQAVLAAHAAA
jgi:AcrR family transcriptional regulator